MGSTLSVGTREQVPAEVDGLANAMRGEGQSGEDKHCCKPSWSLQDSFMLIYIVRSLINRQYVMLSVSGFGKAGENIFSIHYVLPSPRHLFKAVFSSS